MPDKNDSPTLWAGTASEDLTPPPGVRLSGFAGRPSGGNTGAHDRLRASALYVRDRLANTAALVLTLDIIGLSPEDDAALRHSVAAAVPVPPENVLIACSHTHAGPATMMIRATGDREDAWTDEVIKRTIRAAKAAAQNASPVAGFRKGVAGSDAAINRRAPLRKTPDGAPKRIPLDTDCRVLLLDSPEGRPIAALLHYAMHPVTRGRDTKVSADWVFVARDMLETSLGCPALYLQGCCGDINPGSRVTLNPDDPDRPMEIAGRSVGEAAIQAARTATPLTWDGPAIASGSATAPLPQNPVPDAATLTAIEKKAAETLAKPGTELAPRHIAESDQEWAAACRRIPADAPSTRPVPVSALRLGGCTLIGLPGEIFTEIGESIRHKIPNAWTVGFANGNVGYLYPDDALEEGGYEVQVAYRLYGNQQAGKGTADALVKAAVEAAATT